MKETPYIVAEIGCNHTGSMETAHRMIKIAANYCGVDVIKFQKRCPRELLTKDQYEAPHPVPENSYGRTYGEHREFLEFTLDEHAQLKKWCEEEGVEYSTSVWDLTSAKEIASLSPKMIKVPSASNTNFDMLLWLCENYVGEIHLSVGMTTKQEERSIVELFRRMKREKDLLLYSCTSGYPVPAEDVCLLEIARLKKSYLDVKAIGFSGHHLGIEADIAAHVLGANYIERHFTLNHSWKGTDHRTSLEPDEMYRFVASLHKVHMCLRYKEEVLPIEQEQWDKLKYRK